MGKKAPQAPAFKEAVLWYRIYSYVLIGSFIFMLLVHIIFNDFFTTNSLAKDVSEFVSLTIVVMLFVLLQLYNAKKAKAENERRDVLIDNSFGEKFAMEQSVGYFDTENVSIGIKKLLANIHENSFFTSRIVKKMLSRQRFMVVMAGIVLFWCAFEGFKNIMISGLILDFFLAGLLLERCICLKGLKDCTESIETEARALWERMSTENECVPSTIKIVLSYETCISSSNIVLSQFLYEKMNPSLTKEWKEIMKRYNIGE